ncbi:cilia- and flagella-associated protein 99 [Girardinichthys multiradiatus]|uniref:cilia- and flagella-associated protein 99 n=1 Tax=Girardinichthys multiradiatus TaxID=208333 RepID=UPI001FAD6591|nr:cilia- and flagella-associated protein 99 [Girardinichthys multiradiatus]
MASRFGSLVKEACVLLDKFTSDNRCVDVFIEEASTSTDLQSIDPAERKFILEVVSGCVEYKKLLNVVISAFYGQNKKWLCRSDRSQFIITCYLAIFSLDELGLEHFSSIIKSLGTLKMHLFLDFFFSNLTSWIQEEWNSIYEAEFVERLWIGPLLRWRPEINLLMDQLAVTKESEVRRGPVKTTQCQEFNLSKPKPRPLPMPELIPLREKSKSVPNTTYTAPREVQILEKIKQQNQQKAEELLIDAKMNHFRCGNPQKSELTKRVISQINAEVDSKLKFDSFHSSGIPPSKKVDSCSVKLNNAAIRRREALHDRQVKEELQRIERLVQGARDPSPYLQRQREMLEKDLQEKLQTTERKRLETQISEQEVALARTRITERNQKAAQLKKEETAQLMQIYAEKRLKEEKEFRDLVQQVTEGQNNTKAAKEEIRKLKQKIVKEVSEQSQELLRQALEEQQEELCRKFKIIHEIHAIESLPRIRPSSFDDTETGGHELLSEMSLVELKERLALLRQHQQTQQEERRSHILEEKQKKKQEMLETLDNIELHRRVLAKEAAERKEEKKAKQELQQQLVAQDETILALKKKLEEKKQACQRVRQAERSRTKPCKKTPTGTPSQRDLKEKTWEELEQSIARYIQETQ